MFGRTFGKPNRAILISLYHRTSKRAEHGLFGITDRPNPSTLAKMLESESHHDDNMLFSMESRYRSRPPALSTQQQTPRTHVAAIRMIRSTPNMSYRCHILTPYVLTPYASRLALQAVREVYSGCNALKQFMFVYLHIIYQT